MDLNCGDKGNRVLEEHGFGWVVVLPGAFEHSAEL